MDNKRENVYTPPPAGQIDIITKSKTSFIGGIVGGLSGFAIGTLFGSIRIKIPINRSIDKFKKNKERLEKYSFIH